MDRVGSGLTQVLLLYYSACNFCVSFFSVADGSNVIHRGKIYRGFFAHVSLDVLVRDDLINKDANSKREYSNAYDEYGLVFVHASLSKM